MTEERPPFTLDAGAREAPRLPLEAWALACAGAGALAGALARAASSGCTGASSCPRALEGLSLLLAAPFLAGAAAWWLAPVRRDREALVRTIALMSIAGGCAAALSVLWVAPFAPLILAVAAGLAAPLVMLSAARPEAALQLATLRGRTSVPWLRAGAVPVSALFLGFAGGALGAAPGGSAAWAAFLGGALLAAGGVVALRLSTLPSGEDPAGGALADSRLLLLRRLTPMLRYDVLAEVALAFTLAASAFALLARSRAPEAWALTVEAIALGGLLGSWTYGVAGPALDRALGRGRLLATATLAGGAVPLFVGASLAASDPIPAFFAAAVAAFALATAPQRYALTFDLAASRGRLRQACDIQGLKLAAAAAGPLAYGALETGLPGLALVVASGLCLLAFAVFAPTLGGLGRRQT